MAEQATLTGPGRSSRGMARFLQACKNELGRLVYRCNGRIPFTLGRGYGPYRSEYLQATINNQQFLRKLQSGCELPPRCGFRLDERAIEIPWAMAKLLRYEARSHFLDAGSTLNHQMIVEHPLFRRHKWTILTLAPEAECFWTRSISYVFEDLRSMPFRDGYFESVFCISVIEHVGMDNTIYSADEKHCENNPDDYLNAIDEIKRVLRPGGWLYITFPFGRYENHGWLQQFDSRMLGQLTARFEPRNSRYSFFRYGGEGWMAVQEQDCSNCRYSDIGKFANHPNSNSHRTNLAPTAEAVACLELQK